MANVSMREAKNRLTELARKVEAGEIVTITRNGKPVLDLVPHRNKGGIDLPAGQAWLESRGYNPGLIRIAPDFDDPLPEDILFRPNPDQE